MFRVAICDDDAGEIAKIEGIVRSYADFDLHTYTDSRKLVQEIMDGSPFDLYLLDLVMPGVDGIELAHLIRETDETAVIIYLTSHEGRALDAYRVRAAQYLTKPVKKNILLRELNIALGAAEGKKNKTLMLKTKTGIKAIPFHRIVCCELERRCLCCTTVDGAKYTSLMLRSPFIDNVAPLLEDGRFIRPHTSFVVNMDFVNDITGSQFIMKTGTAIPIAQSMRTMTKDRYMSYFFGKELQ